MRYKLIGTEMHKLKCPGITSCLKGYFETSKYYKKQKKIKQDFRISTNYSIYVEFNRLVVNCF